MRARGLAAGALVAASVATVLATGVATADERHADVAIFTDPASVDFWAGRGAGVTVIQYANVGNVPKIGDSLSAPIPAGLTVSAAPAPGWTCHIDDWPALVCTTDTTLEPGQVTSPVRVTVTAVAPVTARMEFRMNGFYRDPTENPADNFATLDVTAT